MNLISFKKYLGPYFRNKVQYLTRNYKKKVGCCEHCGKQGLTFEFAHKKNFNRSEIIETLYEKFSKHDNLEDIIVGVENAFLEQHKSLKDIGYVLCRQCHSNYDMKGEKTNG